MGPYGAKYTISQVTKSGQAFVMYTAVLSTPGEAHIYSDNQAVVDGYHKGCTFAHGNMDDLWETFWAVHDLAVVGKWTFHVHKIKSHTLERDFNEFPYI